MPALPIVFSIGISVMISGAALRMWCYGTLGKLFTYEVSIQPNHELITSGPYALVRHPSYTGATLMVIGAAITCLAPGSFINECNILVTPIRWVVALWLIMAVFTFGSLRRRGQVEDEELRKTFGEVWYHYSQAVPYSFIPYLY
jgi:protein-S-isoprenylcysteine O-methyltransferase Ste14